MNKKSIVNSNPLTNLQVVGIRYRRTQPAINDERSLNAYLAAKVYEKAQVPFDIVEPQMIEEQRIDDEPANLGLFGGQIANEVAKARQSGKAVLMSGGDCSHITGVVGGLQDAHGIDTRIGLIWFDAHGDFNTPNTSFFRHAGRYAGVGLCGAFVSRMARRVPYRFPFTHG